jgi:hypothetical protein
MVAIPSRYHKGEPRYKGGATKRLIAGCAMQKSRIDSLKLDNGPSTVPAMLPTYFVATKTSVMVDRMQIVVSGRIRVKF